MSPERRQLLAKKACSRCSTQKRRCDKVLPECGLCMRLHQICKYELPRISSSGPTPSPSPRPDLALGLGAFTPKHVKDTIVHRLEHLTPEEVLSEYRQAIDPWFPVIAIPRLQNRLPSTWNEVDLDVALLCLSILLLTTAPPSCLEDESETSVFKSLYLCVKYSVALTEGLGINSFLIVQSRLLVTLFEVAHGLYPAAYTSIGSTVRATDALEVHPQANSLISQSSDDEEKREAVVLTWCGILVLDRYIAIESGSYPSLTRPRTEALHDILKPILCPTHDDGQDLASPICRLARLSEAASLLDKLHTILNSPTDDHVLNMEQLVLTVQALYSFRTVIEEEIRDCVQLHAGGLALCNIALVLAFENGSKVPFISGVTENCNFIATTSLITIISNITTMIEPFIMGTETIDFNLLPPFVILLVYKTASIVTERLLANADSNNDGLRNLKILREFLKLVGTRWLACERYLTLLNEDTTPRILKGIA